MADKKPKKSPDARQAISHKQSVMVQPIQQGAVAAGAVQRALTIPHTLMPAEVLALQSTIGNRAVQRLVAAHSTDRSGAATDRGPTSDRQPTPPQLRKRDASIQRMRLNPEDGAYYSDASPNITAAYKAENNDNAFMTATSNAKAVGGGHTSIYLEYFDETGAPLTYEIDLTVGESKANKGSSGMSSGSSTGASSGTTGSTMEGSSKGRGTGRIFINQHLLAPGEAAVKIASKGRGLKKSWKRSRAQALAAKEAADQIQVDVEQKRYKYYLLGKGPAKLVLNCTRFGQKVLKAADIPIHIGFWKLPSKITKASKKDESIQEVNSLRGVQAQNSAFPTNIRTQSGFVSATHIPPGHGAYTSMNMAGKMMERYHLFEESALKYWPLTEIIPAITYYLKRTAIGAHEGGLGDEAYLSDPTVRFFREIFYPAFQQEVETLIAAADQGTATKIQTLASSLQAVVSKDSVASLVGHLKTQYVEKENERRTQANANRQGDDPALAMIGEADVDHEHLYQGIREELI